MTRAIVATATCLLAALAGPAPAPAQVTLEFKFPEGRTSTYENRMSVDQTLTINGQAIPTLSKQTSGLTTKVGAPRDGDVTPLTQTLGHVKAELSLPGGIELDIDSSDPENPEGEQPQLTAIRETIRALEGLSFTILVGPDGKVAGVEGVEEALKGDLAPQVAAGLRQRLDPETLTLEYNQEYTIFPAEPVSTGDTWEREDLLNLGEGQSLTFQRTYAYEGTVDHDGKTLDRVNITATGVAYAMENPNSPLQVKNSDLKVVESKGELLFDREAGQVVESRNTTRMTGSLVLSAGGQDLPAELDLTITTGTTLESSE